MHLSKVENPYIPESEFDMIRIRKRALINKVTPDMDAVVGAGGEGLPLVQQVQQRFLHLGGYGHLTFEIVLRSNPGCLY